MQTHRNDLLRILWSRRYRCAVDLGRSLQPTAANPRCPGATCISPPPALQYAAAGAAVPPRGTRRGGRGSHRESGKPPHAAASERVTLRGLNTSAPIDFYFDLSSPYSYVASEWIEALAARHGRTVRWQASLLGATFQAAALKSPVSHPLKREYSLRDFERSARHAGVPLAIPAKFSIPTQNAARAFWWLDAEDGARAADRARCCLRALFAVGCDLSDATALDALAVRFGLDAGQAAAVAADARWKLRLKAANDAAIAAGVFGAPFFMVDGEPFWGNDRRPQIERWLAQGPF